MIVRSKERAAEQMLILYVFDKFRVSLISTLKDRRYLPNLDRAKTMNYNHAKIQAKFTLYSPKILSDVGTWLVSWLGNGIVKNQFLSGKSVSTVFIRSFS